MELKATATKEVFILMAKANIKEYLPYEYKNAKVETKEIHKPTGSYTALLVQHPSHPMTPAVNLDFFYDMYCEDRDLKKVLEKIAETVTSEIPEGIKINPMRFEEVKDKLFVKLVNGEGKEELKAAVPHRHIEDMLLVYCIRHKDAVITISNELLDCYELTEEELYEAALENGQKIFPVEIGNVGAMLGTGTDNLTIVTNQEGYCGAAAILYPHVIDDVAKGSRVYLLPSSIHEFLVCDGDSDPEELKKIVIAANSTVVEPEDQLSDHVYAYENGELKTVA